jgi:cystathionine beta-lyase
VDGRDSNMKYDFDEYANRRNTGSIKWSPSVLDDEDTLPLWIADMDFRCPQPVIDRLVKTAEHGIYGYPERPNSYYDAVIGWYEKKHGWKIEKDWIVVTPGIIPALHLMVQTFCMRGDQVIVQTPIYYPFFQAILSNGCHIVYNQLHLENGQYVMDLEALEKQARDPKAKLIILCNPHNPIGRVWAKEELKRLGDICIDNDILVVADEIHSDFIYRGFQHTVFSMISDDFSENSIICTAPSKTFNLAGLQVSNIVIPNKRIKQDFVQTLEGTGINLSNTFGIAAATAAYEEGEEWLTQLLVYLEGNIDFLERFILEKMPEVKFFRPQGTYLGWFDFRSIEQDPKQLEDLMRKKANVLLDEGYIFGKGGEGFERINFACPRSILDEAMNRIYKAIGNR